MNLKPTQNPWLVCAHPNPEAQTRLFCFPFAGGGSVVFWQWQNNLPSSVEVHAAQLPGRENRLRETPFTSMIPVIQYLAEAIYPYATQPFAFFGHSLGAVIAFELARYLRREAGVLPICLFASGSRAPQIHHVNDPIHSLPEDKLIVRLREMGGTPEAALQSEELIQLLMPCLRSDLSIWETYVYHQEPPLNCPISALGATEDSMVNLDGVAAWRDQTLKEFVLRSFSGHHFFINTCRQQVLQAISEDLLRFA